MPKPIKPQITNPPITCHGLKNTKQQKLNQTETNPRSNFHSEAGIISNNSPNKAKQEEPTKNAERKMRTRWLWSAKIENKSKNWFFLTYIQRKSRRGCFREREREPVEEKGRGKKDERGKGVGVEDEDQVAHTLRHGLFANYH